jgi:hypothetical protein
MSVHPWASNNSLALILWLLETGKLLYRWWRRSLARNWPLANGAIEHAEIGPGHQRGAISTPGAHLRYSYSVDGEWYGGELDTFFDDSQQALEFVVCAKGKPIRVSFNPDDPQESSITTEQLAAAKSGLFAEAAYRLLPSTAGQPALPLLVRWLVYILMAAALSGFAISLCLHVAALAGRLLLTEDQLLAIVVAGIASVFATLFLEVWGSLSREDSVNRRPPMSLRGPMYFFWAVSGFYFVISTYFPAMRGPLFNRQAMCSFGEFVFWGLLITLYSAVTARKFTEASPVPSPLGAGTS